MKYDEHDSTVGSPPSGHINLFETSSLGGTRNNNNSGGSANRGRINNQVKRKYYATEFNVDGGEQSSGGGDKTSHHTDLCLVGYSCNLYRDDLTALKLESDKNYLLPWNGDQNLLIDRYDCRGYLYDLDPYDADRLQSANDVDKRKWSSEEIEMERVCDLERYKDLLDDESNNQDDSDQLGNHKTGAAIGFVYSESDTPEAQPAESKLNNEAVAVVVNERTFEPPESLQLPVGMLIPETVRMNQIIMKTASFVAKSGLQMEILLKAKQAANSQFDFLNYDSPLNPYYKHVQQLIRDKKLDPTGFLAEPAEIKKEEEKKESDNDQSDDDDDEDTPYLHPLLFKSSVVQQEEKKPAAASPINNESSDQNKVSATSSATTITSSRVEETTVIVEEPEDETSRLLVDKMVEYVLKNGPEFEESIRQKRDERFSFLNEDNKYFNYYRSRLMQRQDNPRRAENDLDKSVDNNSDPVLEEEEHVRERSPVGRERPRRREEKKRSASRSESRHKRRRRRRRRHRRRSSSRSKSSSSSRSESDDESSSDDDHSSSASSSSDSVTSSSSDTKRRRRRRRRKRSRSLSSKHSREKKSSRKKSSSSSVHRKRHKESSSASKKKRRDKSRERHKLS